MNDSKHFVREGRYNKNKILVTMDIKQSEFSADEWIKFMRRHIKRDRDLASTEGPAVNEFSV